MFPWSAALLAGPALLLPLSAYCLSRPRVKGARWYGVLLLAIAWWSLAYAWELSAHDLATKSLALKIKYFGVVGLPPAWIGFILEFVGSEPGRVRARVAPLAVVGVAVLAVIWTDAWHGLFWGRMTVTDIGSYLVLQGRGPVFWLNVGYTYVVLASGLVLLVLHTVNSPYLYRTRAGILLVGTIVPWAGNLVFMLHRDETIFDPTPFLFTCTALIAALAVFRYDLLEPVPTLRDARIGSVGDGVIILDTRGRVADLNAAAESVLGQRRAEAAGTLIDGLLPHLPHGVLANAPVDLTIGDGADRRIYDVRCSPVQSRAKHTTGTVVILRDVTERRAAEAALRESERRYRTVIEQAFDGVWLTDWNDRIADVNPQACALLEASREELIGRPTSECVTGVDDGATLPDEAALRRGEAVSWEREWETRSGRRVLVAGRSKQIGADLIVSTFRDVTEERAHARLREQLLNEAQAANKLKDEFLATVSHELRTPLNAVMGWTHMLVRQQMDAPRMARALSIIERNALAQARLVDDLLDLSGLSGGRTRLDVQAASVPLLIQETIDAVTPSAAAKRVSLTTEMPSDLPAIPADPGRLRQVIWNLLTNAIKFTPPGGRVTVRAATTGADLAIEVADTGSGIAPDFLPHVFEPFRQADGIGTRTSRGLGLGLAIVRRIVEAHGGHVSAESDGIGLGAIFRLHLPLIHAQTAAKDAIGGEPDDPGPARS